MTLTEIEGRVRALRKELSEHAIKVRDLSDQLEDRCVELEWLAQDLLDAKATEGKE